MQQIYAQLSGQRFYLKLFLHSKQQSSFKIEITSTMMNLIQSLTLRWMVIASIWGNFYGTYLRNGFSTSISNSNPYTWTRNGLSPINVTGTVNVFSVLLGFDVTASTSINELSIKLDSLVRASTSHAGTLTSDSATSLTLSEFSYSELAIN